MPADPKKCRFLLFGITYLLSTPSDFANVFDRGGDVEKWLESADIKDKDVKKLCIDFANALRRHPVAYPLMNALRIALQAQLAQIAPGLYTDPPCPGQGDSLDIMKAMGKL